MLHRRAFRFFIDSLVKSCTFRAFACDAYDSFLRGDCFTCGPDGSRCSNMGNFAHVSGRGNMYLVTRDTEPFCGETTRLTDNCDNCECSMILIDNLQIFNCMNVTRCFIAANQFKIRVVSSATQGSTWGRLEIQFLTGDGLNETFVLSEESDEIKDTGYIQGLVVAHPDIRNVTHVQLTYSKYKGWIYSGKSTWMVKKIEIVDSDGHV